MAASIGRRRKKTRHTVGKRTKSRSRVIVVGKRRRSHTKMSGIGSTGIGKTRKTRRKKHGFLGSTGGSKLMQVAEMAVGVGIGAAATHMVLRPMEHKISQKFPWAGKLMGAGEIVLGGLVALKSTKPFIKSIGIGILAGGVHTVMQQTKLGIHSPAVNGLEDMTTLHVPINGDMREMMAGLIENNGNRYVRTPVVGKMGVLNDHNGPTYTPTVGDPDDSMGTLTEEERDYLYSPRGM